MRACCPNLFMYGLAITTETGLPMAATPSCSEKCPLYVRYLNMKSKRLVTRERDRYMRSFTFFFHFLSIVGRLRK